MIFNIFYADITQSQAEKMGNQFAVVEKATTGQSMPDMVQSMLLKFGLKCAEQNVALNTRSESDMTFTFKIDDNDCSTIYSDIKQFYLELQNAALPYEAYNKCEIQLLDSNGEVLMYIVGSIQYGNCTAWISPEAEAEFIYQVGPK